MGGDSRPAARSGARRSRTGGFWCLDAGGVAAVRPPARWPSSTVAIVTTLAVIEVPAALPLDAHMPAEAEVRERLALAEAIGDRHGVRVERSVVRARRAGEAM